MSDAPELPEHINAIIEAAAERGAKRALERVGLHDDYAGKDINDLRTLIEGWRQAKQTVARTIMQAATMALLGALALGTYLQMGGKK
jgi:hypothetical protein